LAHFVDFRKQRGFNEQTTAIVDAQLHQLVMHAAADDVELLKQTIAELERENAAMQNEVSTHC